MGCVFCKIGRGEAEAAVLYEDSQTIAFLDINPIAEGHTLVVPKEHYEGIFDVDPLLLQQIFFVAKKVADQLRNTLGAEGINIFHASEQAAEQSVFHFHIHVIPRRRGDRLDFNTWWFTKFRAVDRADLRRVAARMRFT